MTSRFQFEENAFRMPRLRVCFACLLVYLCFAGNFCLAQGPTLNAPPNDASRKALISTIFAIKNHKSAPLYIDSILPSLPPTASAKIVPVNRKATDLSTFEHPSNKVDINLEKIEAKDRLQLIIESGDKANAIRIPLTLHEALPGNSEPIRILLIGDSITNRTLGAAIREKLVSSSYRPEFIGTVLGKRLRGSSEAEVAGEGREGWSFSDFVHGATGATARDILGPSQDDTANYMRLDNRSRVGINPFLRPSRQTDDRSAARDGHTFDFRQYLERFNLPVPDVVVIGLGTNDIRKSGEFAPDAVSEGLTIMCRAIRQAAPRTRIGIWMPAIARTNAMTRRWQAQTSVIARILAWQREAKDPLIQVIPVWAQMDRDAAWLPDRNGPAASLADADPQAVRDPIHPSPLGVDQIAEPLAAYIVDAAGHGL